MAAALLNLQPVIGGVLKPGDIDKIYSSGGKLLPQNTFHDKSTFVQVMDWWVQVTSRYLSQSWPRFMMPYDVTMLIWETRNKQQLG